MTREEAKAYFEECNDGIITASKDENVYDYEKQEIMSVFMRRTYEANAWAISALFADVRPNIHGHWVEHKVGYIFKQIYFSCSVCGNTLDPHGLNCGRGDANFCPNCGAIMDEEPKGENDE